MNEEWRKISGADYEVSSLGRVRRSAPGTNTWVGKLKKLQKGPKGYLTVGIYLNGRAKSCYVHRLVAEAFFGPLPKRREVNHKDGNKKNNKLENLEYVTHLANQRHASKNFLMASGDRVGTSKLNWKLVKEIRTRASTESKYLLAKEYDVCPQTIYNIAYGRTWK